MTPKRILLATILFIILFSFIYSKCSAQDTLPPAMRTNCFDYSKEGVKWDSLWFITNLEYVTIRNITGKHKLYHVKYLALRREGYYFPNLTPVQVINYKIKGQPEVIVKK